jgi:uncharacterized protein YndB with AHSA1/START domain
VWHALTDPAVLAIWMMESTLTPPVRVGQRFQFRAKPAPGFDGIIECVVVAADPPRRLAYSWASGKGRKHQTRVEWTLSPEGPGTRLVLEHSGFDGLTGFLMRAMMRGGWGRKVTRYLTEVTRRLEVAGDDSKRIDRSSVMECDADTTSIPPSGSV